MTQRVAKILFALAVGVGCSSVYTPGPVQAQDADPLVMVVNKANAVAEGTKLQDARKLLLGETASWRNGAKVLVVLGPAGSPGRDLVLKKVAGMTEASFTRLEMQASFTGQSVATIEVAPSEIATRNTVKANPGAFGFIHKSQVDETVTSVLEVE